MLRGAFLSRFKQQRMSSWAYFRAITRARGNGFTGWIRTADRLVRSGLRRAGIRAGQTLKTVAARDRPVTVGSGSRCPCARRRTARRDTRRARRLAAARRRTPARRGRGTIVPRAGVDPDRPQRRAAPRRTRHHPHRVPVQPALPDLGRSTAGARVERQPTVPSSSAEKQAATPSVMSRSPSACLVNGGARRKSAHQRRRCRRRSRAGAARRRRILDVAQLVQGVAGVGGQRAEQVGPQHRRDHRAEAAAGLAHDRRGAPRRRSVR